MNRIKYLFTSEKAEANYISSTIFLLISVICIMLIMNIFSIVSAKLQLDQAVDQMAKQVQLSGGKNTNTTALFGKYQNSIKALSDMQFGISSTQYVSPTPSGMITAVQLGTPFDVIIWGTAKLGGFSDIMPVYIRIKSTASGVSEVYWK